jgi:excisionase family DNA binding protein
MLKELRDEKILLSLREVSELLGISYGKARVFTYEQNMQVRIGRRILIHRKKLEKWINDQVK